MSDNTATCGKSSVLLLGIRPHQRRTLDLAFLKRRAKVSNVSVTVLSNLKGVYCTESMYWVNRRRGITWLYNVYLDDDHRRQKGEAPTPGTRANGNQKERAS